MRIKQFSLLTILIATAVLALTMSVAIRWLYKPETHKVLAYEKATPVAGLKLSIEGKPLSVVRVTRNDRSQRIVSENGKRKPVVFALPNGSSLITSSPWLDVAELELSYDTQALEIDRIRIFDHRKRQLLGEKQAIGWRLVDAHHIHIYGFQDRVPDQIDLWLDMNRLHSDISSYSLAMKVGSQIDLPNGVLKITDIREGHLGWTSSQPEGSRFIEDSSSNEIEPATSMEIEFSGDWQLGRMQFVAVARDGERVADDYFQDFTNQPRSLKPIFWPWEPAEIDRIELRPLPSETKFYFDGIQLPVVQNAPFASPPSAMRSSVEVEAGVNLNEYAPLAIQLKSHRGNVHSGSTSSSSGVWFKRYRSVQNQDSVLALEQSITGVPLIRLDIVPILKDPSAPASRGRASTRFSSGTGYTGSQTIGVQEFLVAPTDVEGYQLNLANP